MPNPPRVRRPLASQWLSFLSGSSSIFSRAVESPNHFVLSRNCLSAVWPLLSSIWRGDRSLDGHSLCFRPSITSWSMPGREALEALSSWGSTAKQTRVSEEFFPNIGKICSLSPGFSGFCADTKDVSEVPLGHRRPIPRPIEYYAKRVAGTAMRPWPMSAGCMA